MDYWAVDIHYNIRKRCYAYDIVSYVQYMTSPDDMRKYLLRVSWDLQQKLGPPTMRKNDPVDHFIDRGKTAQWTIFPKA